MNNPLTGGSKKETFDDGTYSAVLSDVTVGEKKKFESEEVEPCLVFKFTLTDLKSESGSPITIEKRTGTSIYWGGKYPMSALIKFITMAAPNVFKKADCDGNRDEIWRRINLLKGKGFNLTCSQNEKGYMQIVAAQLVAKKADAPKAAPVVEAAPISDDDIPF